VRTVLVQIAVIELWLPLLVLAHELGHAAVALTVTRSPVLVQLGRTADRGPRLNVGRLTIVFSGLGLAGGRCVHGGWLTRREAALLGLAGPAVNLVAGAVLLAAAIAVGHPGHGAGLIWLGGAVASLQAGVVNLVPFHTGREVSDGALIYQALTGRTAPGARPPERQLRPFFIVLLAIVGVLVIASAVAAALR
jgi:hypothetical protein